MDKHVKFTLAPHVHKAAKLAAEKTTRRRLDYFVAELVEGKVYELAEHDPLIKAALDEGREPLSRGQE